MYPKTDFFIGLFLIALSTVGHIIAEKLPEVERGLGPGDYPQAVLRILFILGILLAGHAYYQLKKMPENKVSHYEKGELRQIFLLVLCVALYIKLVAYFGFILLTAPFIFLMMLIFGLREWIRMVIISVVSTAVIYVLFNNFLLVLLPRFNLFS